MGKEAAQRRRSESHATRCRRAIRARQMQEHGAAPARHPRTSIVVDLDHDIVEVVLAPQPVAWFIRRALERPVVAPVRRILAPGDRRVDPALRQKRVRLYPAIRPPP